jgi:DNA helicase II / ATP-dependent DNA helicase PcrA
VRLGDLDALEQIAGKFATREQFLTELSLDPPQATGDLAGPPLLDEDYLVLSTIHSAKGQEWDSVYVLNVADGNFPSEFATGKPALIEEERRLLYVAMTRAKSGAAPGRAAEVLGAAAAPARRPARLRRAQPLHRRGDDGLHGAALPRRRRAGAAGAPRPAEVIDIGARLRAMW